MYTDITGARPRTAPQTILIVSLGLVTVLAIAVFLGLRMLFASVQVKSGHDVTTTTLALRSRMIGLGSIYIAA